MRQEANRNGLKPEKIFLVSAAKKKNLADLMAFLAKKGELTILALSISYILTYIIIL